jgi:glutamine synthetase
MARWLDLSGANRAYVVRTVRERAVRFIRLWFVDVLGMLKSFSIRVTELESALADGVDLDGSALEGVAGLAERDVIAYRDPHTVQLLPRWPGSLVARTMCDIRVPDGTPFVGDSRHALRCVRAKAVGLGFNLSIGAEIEFFLFQEHRDPGKPPLPIDKGAYFDLTPLDDGSDFRRATIEYLEQMGIPVKASHHDVATSQGEIKLAHSDELSIADAVTTFGSVIKEVAREQGMFSGRCSSTRAGADGGHQPMGQLQQTAGMALRRRLPGSRGPGTSASALVPSSRPGREVSARIELCSSDSACKPNPYLCFAMLLAVGLRGVERGYQLLPETTNDTAAAASTRLPEDLREAADPVEGSELVNKTLGEVLTGWHVANKCARVGRLPPDGDGVRTTSLPAGGVTTRAANG